MENDDQLKVLGTRVRANACGVEIVGKITQYNSNPPVESTDADKVWISVEDERETWLVRADEVTDILPNTYTTKTGEVLTDEDIQALADEAERGYDVS